MGVLCKQSAPYGVERAECYKALSSISPYLLLTPSNSLNFDIFI